MIKINRLALLPATVFLSTLLTVPLLNSCGGGSQNAASAPIDDSVGRNLNNRAPVNQPQAKRGLSTGQKVAILAGAAGLYYLYNQRKNTQGTGAQGKHYLSKNGRVYYRDAKGRPIWVTPPQGGIRVPEEEAQQYRNFQGYNNSPTGRDLRGLSEAPVPTN
ncbi:hypothetical protein [Nostoc sp.]|uniref:hypothetical protein n=1 Tax=Nostoc sp. TaxID=1180 RepID=UPI002FFA0486